MFHAKPASGGRSGSPKLPAVQVRGSSLEVPGTGNSDPDFSLVNRRDLRLIVGGAVNYAGGARSDRADSLVTRVFVGVVLVDDLAMPMTQARVGDLVGISQQPVSDLVRRTVLADGAGADEWLLAYCDHLREVAAGRGGSGEKCRAASAGAWPEAAKGATP